ncbi:MAG: leucyl/phenylalanyl-tRNA--protein transferase [Rhodanobacter sp.]
MIVLPQLDAEMHEPFPDPVHALQYPNGLLAFGGDLSLERLLDAYQHGIFPWFGEGQPILWWSPDPRCVFRTVDLRINRSLRRQLRGKPWRLTVDHAFANVMHCCAMPRDDDAGTWISPAMIDAYVRLHELGHAHSIEVWDGQRLVGGVYGVAVGKLFCGESMFSAESGGSKLALVSLAQLLRDQGYPLIDAQVANAHTLDLGAVELPRTQFLEQVSLLTAQPGNVGSWRELTERLQQS